MKYTNVVLTVLVALMLAVTYRVYSPVTAASNAPAHVAQQGSAMVSAPADTVEWNPVGTLTITRLGRMVVDSVFPMAGNLAFDPCGDRIGCGMADNGSGAGVNAPQVPVTLRVFRASGGDTTITLKHGARFVLRKATR